VRGEGIATTFWAKKDRAAGKKKQLSARNCGVNRAWVSGTGDPSKKKADAPRSVHLRLPPEERGQLLEYTPNLRGGQGEKTADRDVRFDDPKKADGDAEKKA